MKALLLGGTGAMGGYLQGELRRLGLDVYVTTRKVRPATDKVTFIQGNAHDVSFLDEVLKGAYDIVVDFMVWQPEDFASVANSILRATGRYVFLSSYRIFADSPVITEKSPRLLDVCSDKKYRTGGEYAIIKAQEEDWLRSYSGENWTIVRPAITFSGEGAGRFQLCTYESSLWLWRAVNGLAIPIVPEMMDKQCTLTWAGDVARMIAQLAMNPKAAGEDFNVATSQHQSWGEILDIYKSVLRIETRAVSLQAYESHCGKAIKEYGYIPQVRYDRMVNRVLDNTKVLAFTGLGRHDISDVAKVLPRELASYLRRGERIVTAPAVQGRLDRITSSAMPFGTVLSEFGVNGALKYLAGRIGVV